MEQTQAQRKNFTLQIFATDLDRDAIDKARQGVFPANIAADVSPERLSRFFIQGRARLPGRKEIREMVIFAPQNLIMDPPFTKLDILSCRNLLIYLTPEVQKKLIPLFHYSLNPGGILFLGSAETIGDFTDLFAPLDGKSRLFRRTRIRPADRSRSSFPRPLRPRRRAPEPPPASKPAANLQSLADQLLLQQLLPAGRAGQRQGRHPLHQRPDRQIPGTGRRQGQLEHLCHGPRRAALRTGRRLPEGAPAKRRGHPARTSRSEPTAETQAVDITVQAIDGAGGAAGIGDDRLHRRGNAPGSESAGQRQTAIRPQRRAGGTGAGTPAGPPRGADHPRGDADLPGRSSGPPTRNCSPPTRNCSPPTRN